LNIDVILLIVFPTDTTRIIEEKEEETARGRKGSKIAPDDGVEGIMQPSGKKPKTRKKSKSSGNESVVPNGNEPCSEHLLLIPIIR